MSVLAERKRREKWSLDPRNTFWSNDKSKFGYRMLERMGWNEGKGLGVNEEGRQEHVKVKKKGDHLGLGAKKGRDDYWIQHQDSFDQLLANLNAQQTTATTKTAHCHSNEEISPTKTLIDSAAESKRLMYKRFLRSKDLSVASSEDLDCVLGRKKKKISTQHQSEGDLSVPESKEDDSVSVIPTVTSTKTMKEYFSEKLGSTCRQASDAGTQKPDHRTKPRKSRTKSQRKRTPRQ